MEGQFNKSINALVPMYMSVWTLMAPPRTKALSSLSLSGYARFSTRFSVVLFHNLMTGPRCIITRSEDLNAARQIYLDEQRAKYIYIFSVPLPRS